MSPEGVPCKVAPPCEEDIQYYIKFVFNLNISLILVMVCEEILENDASEDWLQNESSQGLYTEDSFSIVCPSLSLLIMQRAE